MGGYSINFRTTIQCLIYLKPKIWLNIEITRSNSCKRVICLTASMINPNSLQIIQNLLAIGLPSDIKKQISMIFFQSWCLNWCALANIEYQDFLGGDNFCNTPLSGIGWSALNKLYNRELLNFHHHLRC